MAQGKYNIKGLTWYELQEILAVLDPEHRKGYMSAKEREALALKIEEL